MTLIFSNSSILFSSCKNQSSALIKENTMTHIKIFLLAGFTDTSLKTSSTYQDVINLIKSRFDALFKDDTIIIKLNSAIQAQVLLKIGNNKIDCIVTTGDGTENITINVIVST